MRIITLIIVWISFTVGAFSQEKPSVQIGLSNETVEISSSFDGTDIIIFGSIENGEPLLLTRKAYHVVVVLTGPNEEVVVRRKERQFGVWLNGKAQSYLDVPSSYSLATTRKISLIADAEEIKILQIGLDNLNVVNTSDNTNAETDSEFREALNRIKSNKSLYYENVGGVEFLTPTLFKAKLAVPANVPIGAHIARAFLFKDGKYVNSTSASMTVKKIGFEQFTYDLAHQNGLLYGIIAVIIAIATGWLASVVFRKD